MPEEAQNESPPAPEPTPETQAAKPKNPGKVDKLREKFETLRARSKPPAFTEDRFKNFTERAKRVLVLSQTEAQRFNHNYIGTEHLLLGLVAEEQGIAAKVLKNLNVSLEQVRSAVEYIIGRGDRTVIGNISLT